MRASNPKVEHHTRAFLNWLNSAGGPPLEQLPPKEARDLTVYIRESNVADSASCTAASIPEDLMRRTERHSWFALKRVRSPKEKTLALARSTGAIAP
jgi:hypothetical protein